MDNGTESLETEASFDFLIEKMINELEDVLKLLTKA
jgi:hypothetical protein